MRPCVWYRCYRPPLYLFTRVCQIRHIHLGNFQTLTLAEEMRNLHLGQSYDLHWSHHSQKPTPEEYFNMVDGSKYLFDLSSLSIQLVDNW